MKTVFTVALAFLTLVGCAQKSPKKSTEGTAGGAEISIVYCAPSARGRTIMGELVPFDKVWRTGANAATTIEFSKDVKIEGKDLKAGKYSLFTIPGEKEWTVIINNETGQSGTQYNESKDVLRVKVKPKKSGEMIEQFIIEVQDKGVKMSWENTEVFFKVS